MAAEDDSPGTTPNTLHDLANTLPPDTQNPWEFQAWVQENFMDLRSRQPFQEPWTVLVQQRPVAERDQLITIAKPIFGFNVSTVRARLKELDRAGGAKLRFTPTLVTDTFLAEMVYRPDLDPQYGFLVWQADQPADTPPEFQPEITLRGVQYQPLVTKLVEAGVVLLPSGVEEYGTDTELYNTVHGYLGRYVYFTNPAFHTLAACYVMMTWMHDRFDALPYLRGQGDLGTGKSRLIQTVGSACYRPILAGGATTPSPVFRIIDGFHGTLIIDEADFSKSDLQEEIVKILNCGYQRGFPVLRSERATEGEAFAVNAYDCFGPKILATRRKFGDDALESRCLSYVMPPTDTIPTAVPLSLGTSFRQDALQLRNKLLLWRFRNRSRVTVDPTARQEGMEPRINQIVQPLLACTENPRLKANILQQVWVYSNQMQANRRESLPGLIAAAAVTCWERSGRRDITVKTVTDWVRSQWELRDLSYKRTGEVLRVSLGVSTAEKGGVYWLKMTPEAASQLQKKYGFDTAQLARVPDAQAVMSPAMLQALAATDGATLNGGPQPA